MTGRPGGERTSEQGRHSAALLYRLTTKGMSRRTPPLAAAAASTSSNAAANAAGAVAGVQHAGEPQECISALCLPHS